MAENKNNQKFCIVNLLDYGISRISHERIQSFPQAIRIIDETRKIYNFQKEKHKFLFSCKLQFSCLFYLFVMYYFCVIRKARKSRRDLF